MPGEQPLAGVTGAGVIESVHRAATARGAALRALAA
jgi:hypothetical protein